MAPPLTFPTFARELLEARAALTVVEEIGLALRAHRRALGLSQRAYALRRGYARSTFARLEAGAGGVKLDDVIAALDGTGFGLYLGRTDPAPTLPPDEPAPASALTPTLPPTELRPEGDGTLVDGLAAEHEDPSSSGAAYGASRSPRPLPGRPPPVPVTAWPRPELIARVRGGTRRFPGHRVTTQITFPPTWWWVHEYFAGSTNPPHWYSSPYGTPTWPRKAG